MGNGEKIPESHQSKSIDSYIQELMQTPAGKIAWSAFAGTSDIDQPYWEPYMSRVHDNIAMPLSITAAISLEAATRDLAPQGRERFFQEYTAAMITFYRYAIKEKYFEEMFRQNDAEMRKRGWKK